jgi:hypothetical protein
MLLFHIDTVISGVQTLLSLSEKNGPKYLFMLGNFAQLNPLSLAVIWKLN